MPPVTQKSGFAASVGAKVNAAIKEHAKDETNYGLIRLPGGINNGVAQLRECGFFQYKPDSNMKDASGQSAVGKYFFRAMGVVVSPLSIATPDGIIPVANLQTSIMIPCVDTKNAKNEVTTMAEHIAGAAPPKIVPNVMNELRKLGAEFGDNVDAVQLEATAEALKKAQPYFRFSTSSSPGGSDPKTGKKFEPRVWENWNGTKGLENWTPPVLAMGMQDNTIAQGTPPPMNGTALGNGVAVLPGAGESEMGDEGADYIDTLVTKADTDEAAQATLYDLALEAGCSDDEAKAALSWSALGDLIKTRRAADGGEGPTDTTEPEPNTETEAPWSPSVEEVYSFHPVDPKTKKPGKKAVNCVVTAVDETKKTVDLKNTVNDKLVYKKVPWDSLESAV